MPYFFAIPACLSLLMLAAHFYRADFPPMVFGSLAMMALLLFRRNWTTRLAQVFLLLSALEWLRTTAAIVQQQQAAGEPWKRGAIIMLSVEAFTVLSAILLLRFLRPRAASRGSLPPLQPLS